MATIEHIYDILIGQQYQKTLFGDLSKLRQTQTGYIACCPFHDDSNPSFSFSEHQPLWHCFGCGEGGDWIQYLEKTHQCSFQEALETLANEAGVQIKPNGHNGNGYKTQQIERALKLSKHFLFESTHRFFIEQLWSEPGQPVRNYLKQRGYSIDEIEGMELGYFPGQIQTKEYLLQQGFKTELIHQYLKWLDYRKDYSLVIPYRDADGQLTSLWGRLIRPLKNGEKEQDKYKPFSSEAKKDSLFNIHLSKEAKTLIIVEGYFDALIATQKGFQGVIACVGSSINNQQIEQLKQQSVKQVILAFDNDEAGQQGINRSIDLLHQHNIQTFVLTLPKQYHDPDDCLQTLEGIEAFHQGIKHPQSAAKWKTQFILKQYDLQSPIQKRQALADILSFEVTLKNPFDKADCFKTYSSELNVTEDDIQLLRNELQREFDQSQRQINYETFFKTGLTKLSSGKLSDTWIKNQLEDLQQHSEIKALSSYKLKQAIHDVSLTTEGLKTGFEKLDTMTRIPHEAITIVAGRPSHGKTTFMLNLFLNMVELYPEKSFFFFSYEESKKKLFLKTINILSQVVLNKSLQSQNLRQLEYYIKGGHSRFDDIQEAMHQYDQLAENRLWLLDERFYVDELVKQLAFLKEKYNVGAVFIDYIQKIKTKDKAGMRQLEIQRISEQILDASINLSIPIIMGAQFGRGGGLNDKVKLDNLREAGDIEQDSNLVLGLFNPSVEKNFQDNDLPQKFSHMADIPREVDLEVHILKNRDGEVGKKVKLCFDRPVLKIRDESSPF